MFRFIAYILIVIAFGLGLATLEQHQAMLNLTFYPYQIQIPLVIAIIGLVLLLLVLYIIYYFIKIFVFSPFYVKTYWQKRTLDNELKYKDCALNALLKGDAVQTRYFYNKFSSFKPTKDNFDLWIESQIMLLEENYGEAQNYFKQLEKQKDKELFGLFGLFTLALKQYDFIAAQLYAYQAYQKAPHLIWARQAMFEKALREQDFDTAEKLFDQIEKSLSLRQRYSVKQRHNNAVFYAARAQALLPRDLENARKFITKALTLDPNFIPISLIGAQIFYALNDQRKGDKWLEKTWQKQPHRDIAALYTQENQGFNLKKAQNLIHLVPDHFESYLLKAKLAIKQKDWGLAKQALLDALQKENNQICYQYLIKIEKEQDNNPESLNLLYEKAKCAEPDFCWIAETVNLEKWQAFSPISGRFDAVYYGRSFFPYQLVNFDPLKNNPAIKLSSEPIALSQNLKIEPEFLSVDNEILDQKRPVHNDPIEIIEKDKPQNYSKFKKLENKQEKNYSNIRPNTVNRSSELQTSTINPEDPSEFYFSDAVWGNEENIMAKPLNKRPNGGHKSSKF